MTTTGRPQLYIYETPFVQPGAHLKPIKLSRVNRGTAESEAPNAIVLTDLDIPENQPAQAVMLPRLRTFLPEQDRLILLWEVHASQLRLQLKADFDLIWPILATGMGAHELTDGTSWVVMRLDEGGECEIVYVIEDRIGRPLNVRLVTLKCFRPDKNTRDVHDLCFRESAIFDRREIGWNLPCDINGVSAETKTQLLVRAKKIFYENINPHLKNAFVTGPGDPLLVRRPLCFEFGNVEILKSLADAAIAVANLDLGDRPSGQVIAMLYGESFYETHSRGDCFASVPHLPMTPGSFALEEFLNDYIVKICFPTGYNLVSKFTGPLSNFKSSYKPVGYHWAIYARPSTAHEQIAAQRRLRAWLMGPAGLTAKEADAALGSLISR